MNGDSARLSALEAKMKAVGTLLVGEPGSQPPEPQPGVVGTDKEIQAIKEQVAAIRVLMLRPTGVTGEPVPGINLAQYHVERYNQIHGIGPANELSTYKYYTDPGFAGQREHFQDFQLWEAAKAAKVVPDSADGLFIALFLSGENYPLALEILGPEHGPAFNAWLLLYRGIGA